MKASVAMPDHTQSQSASPELLATLAEANASAPPKSARGKLLAGAEPTPRNVSIEHFGQRITDAQEIALKAISGEGDFNPALLELGHGLFRSLFILINQFQDPAALKELGGRGRSTLFGIAFDKAAALVGAAEAGAESPDVGPDDPDEGKAAGD